MAEKNNTRKDQWEKKFKWSREEGRGGEGRKVSVTTRAKDK